MLDDAFKEMKKAKPVLEKELSDAEFETANHLAQYNFVYTRDIHARDLREKALKLAELKRRIDFLKIGMQYAQVLSNRIRTIYNLCNCPKDLEEAMSGLLYAGDRYEEIGALARFKSAMEEKYGTRSDIMYEEHLSLNKEVKRCLRVPCPSDDEVLDLIYDIAVRYHILHLLPDTLVVPITDVHTHLVR